MCAGLGLELSTRSVGVRLICATHVFATPGTVDRFVNFDAGKIGKKYGGYPSVGCGKPWYSGVGDPRARFFSLPGRCSGMVWQDKSAACLAADPGGECPAGKSPTGESGCTWRAEPLGEIFLNELVGINDEQEWCRRWGTEWREHLGTHGDRGIGTCFWDQRASPRTSEERARWQIRNDERDDDDARLRLEFSGGWMPSTGKMRRRGRGRRTR